MVVKYGIVCNRVEVCMFAAVPNERGATFIMENIDLRDLIRSHLVLKV